MYELFDLLVVFQDDQNKFAKGIEYSWKITEVTSNSVHFKLKFEDPIVISNGDFDKHSLKLTIKQEFLLISESGTPIDPNLDQQLISTLPMQYAEGSIEESLAEAS